MVPPADRPRVLISACLLGQAVRYDGTDKRSAAVERLLDEVDAVPVCPEVAVGMGVPREPIRIERDGRALWLRGVESGREWTTKMAAWARSHAEALRADGLHGAVLKSRSPSCGPAGVPVHDAAGRVVGPGPGFFAAALLAGDPGLPVIDEAGLEDEAQRAAFTTSVTERFLAQGRAP